MVSAFAIPWTVFKRSLKINSYLGRHAILLALLLMRRPPLVAGALPVVQKDYL